MSSEQHYSRRHWLGSVAALFAGAAFARTASAMDAPEGVVVYKDANCGCCAKWVTHLSANGFKPAVRDRKDMDSLKDSLGIPNALRSCHTAVIGKLLIEGHVPAADIKKFLSAPPKGVLGLAVPGMPNGSPGMETAGRGDRYDVVAFAADGKTSVFATHG